ncbi:hypothetical protein [Nocardiopsis sp. Huas11]|uniref:hypothetical protein n=1 Tax=Nocardiopsis sp. Huas11 TaxID=2183912 RepID=UPI0011C40BC3|nr:hypothetical protein [Nocardiopsis sp. Huas11]
MATDYQDAITRELAVRGRAAHLHRAEGESPAARRAADDYRRAQRDCEQLGTTLFQLRAHRIVPAT